MASIFKRGRDKGKRHAAWYISYDDHEGKRRTKKGYTDKGLTQQLAAKFEREAMLRKRGLIDPEDERRLKVKSSPINEHLNDFEESLADNTPKHVKLTMGRIRRLIEEAEVTTLSSLRVDTVATTLRRIKRTDKFGNRTYNHYVQAIDGFCNWLVDMGRLDRNPLVALERLNTQVDVRHKRRALTPDEFAKLLKSARESTKSVQGYPGPMRAQVYLLSYLTGLRRTELASMTSKSFDLEAEHPVLRVEAACSKHRRKDVLPLHLELVGLLRQWLPADGPLFPELGRRKTWLMVKTDLEDADIPYTTEKGTADFHAAGRHTHITELLRNGASLPEAKELARHSDVKMTMRYTHIGIQDQSRALKRLPCQHIVSNSALSDCQQPSPNGASEQSENDTTPGETEGCDVSCQPLAEADGVEAAGIEPADGVPFHSRKQGVLCFAKGAGSGLAADPLSV